MYSVLSIIACHYFDIRATWPAQRSLPCYTSMTKSISLQLSIIHNILRAELLIQTAMYVVNAMLNCMSSSFSLHNFKDFYTQQLIHKSLQYEYKRIEPPSMHW